MSDTDLIECLLPNHLFSLLMEALEAAGTWELRPDLAENLEKEMARLLMPLDVFSVKRVAVKVDGSARALISALGGGDPRHGLHVVALFTLKLIDEGLHPDPAPRQPWWPCWSPRRPTPTRTGARAALLPGS